MEDEKIKRVVPGKLWRKTIQGKEDAENQTQICGEERMPPPLEVRERELHLRSKHTQPILGVVNQENYLL